MAKVQNTTSYDSLHDKVIKEILAGSPVKINMFNCTDGVLNTYEFVLKLFPKIPEFGFLFMAAMYESSERKARVSCF